MNPPITALDKVTGSDGEFQVNNVHIVVTNIQSVSKRALQL
jgi:hypothetical protein